MRRTDLHYRNDHRKYKSVKRDGKFGHLVHKISFSFNIDAVYIDQLLTVSICLTMLPLKLDKEQIFGGYLGGQALIEEEKMRMERTLFGGVMTVILATGCATNATSGRVVGLASSP